MSARAPEISVVVPVFNEEGSLAELHERVSKTLEGERWELVLVNDGSADRSDQILRELAEAHPEVVAVELSRNFGQHPAVLAGFSVARGDYVVTLDADLQNPPEEIPRLVAELRAGHDAVGSVRSRRQDPWLRKQVSGLVNRVTTASLGIGMTDYGCMLRGYSRELTQEIVELAERSAFIPALATMLARNAVEIDVEHVEREDGSSPIQMVSLTGMAIAVLGVGFAAFLMLRRIIVGPEVEGVFTLFAILFAFIGVLMLAVGVVGEYVGRIYAEVRRRPVYRIREVVAPGRDDADA
jgi:undecaprenyl-phosphate 4-deoxy-4-formamido-L-arabinose transferase